MKESSPLFKKLTSKQKLNKRIQKKKNISNIYTTNNYNKPPSSRKINIKRKPRPFKYNRTTKNTSSNKEKIGETDCDNNTLELKNKFYFECIKIRIYI